MRTDLLIDTGFLYSLLDETDRYHAVVTTVRQIEAGAAVVPDVVLVEATYLALRDGDTPAVVAFLSAFEQLNFQLEPVTLVDVIRARDIMQTSLSSRLDFVDCCLMALSERLDIRRICTIDPLDFRIFRPKHCDWLEILPPQLR